MSWHSNQLKYAFGLGGLFSFYGIVGLIVYMLPPSSVGSTQKIVIIALVLLTLPFALLIGYFASRKDRKKKQAEAAAAAPSSESQPSNGQPAKLSAPAGSYGELNSGTEEVIQFLKNSSLGNGGRDAVYSLPWYMVAGAPRSGKSSLVISSNLNFQPLPSQRASEQKFVRPTGSVDWRVTSDAVFIDTSGRYQTEGPDSDEWSALLETIKKYRSDRPLDGFVLTVDAEELLKSDERQIEERAKVLRARLDEAQQRLKVRFPVYLVFTHADAIEGFRDSFSASKNEDKTLVWGTTIPLEKSENAQTLFDSEYEELRDSVMKRRLMRLSAPFPPVRQLRIFNFPLHFAAARRKFGAFVNALFRPNPFSENPFLRGFYFTATPAAKAAQGAPARPGESYFTERFFRDVLLRDKDLVKTFQAQRQRAPIFGWTLTLLGGFLVLFLLVMSGISLMANKQLLDEAQSRGEKVVTIVKADAGKNTLQKNENETRREINATEDLRETMSRLDNYERNGAPIYMRFGMYSGNSIYKKQLLPIYMSVIEQRYKTPTIKRVEAELQKFASGPRIANPNQLSEKDQETLGKYYDLLKAYLMLTGEFKDKAEPSHLANTLKDYWVAESKVPADMNLVAQQQLDFWAKQVDRDDNDYRFPRISPNGQLVAQVRERLKDFPPVLRYYKRKVTEISKEIDDKVGKTTTDAILSRNGADSSYIEGTYTVPSAYTRPGFDRMKTAIAESNQKLSEDDWVMGEAGRNAVAQTTDASRIEDLYYRDYADHWRNFVKGVNVKNYKNKDDAAAALQSFASANSPMKILLREISKNTNLSAKPEVTGWWDWIKSFFVKAQDTDTGGSQPEKEFRPLFTFVGTKDQKDKAPIEVYQAELGKIYNDFNGISADKLRDIAQKMANDEDPLKIRARETAIQNLVGSFNETPAGQELAALVLEPITNLKELLGADVRSQVIKAWNEQVLPAAKDIEKGYPFDDSQADADLAKLSAYLNPVDGKFSKFYDERLKRYFEESNGQLKQKDGAELKFTDEFVAYLNSAMALRKALYGTSQTPKFEYEFAFRPTKDARVEVTIDGQTTTSDGTGSIKGTFPASGSTETGVIMNSASSGPVSTSGVPPSANSSNSNVSTPVQPATSSSAQPLRYPGNWGLFRFVDAGKPQKQAGGEYLLTYSVGGHPLTATIRPSGGDLFDKNIFRSLKAPQNILK
jgi:type VI secretion system protein ImpL